MLSVFVRRLLASPHTQSQSIGLRGCVTEQKQRGKVVVLGRCLQFGRHGYPCTRVVAETRDVKQCSFRPWRRRSNVTCSETFLRGLCLGVITMLRRFIELSVKHAALMAYTTIAQYTPQVYTDGYVQATAYYLHHRDAIHTTCPSLALPCHIDSYSPVLSIPVALNINSRFALKIATTNVLAPKCTLASRHSRRSAEQYCMACISPRSEVFGIEVEVDRRW
jgi:hypothetical protein